MAASECVGEQSRVLHKASGRSFRYGELAAEAAAITLDREPKLRTPEQFRLIGQSLPRLDIPLKINGSAVYGIDVAVPDMVQAAIMACPVFGGRLKRVDETAIAGARGVMQVVKLPNAVAVVADRYWRARAALARLPIEWDVGPHGSSDSAQFRQAYLDALDRIALGTLPFAGVEAQRRAARDGAELRVVVGEGVGEMARRVHRAQSKSVGRERSS